MLPFVSWGRWVKKKKKQPCMSSTVCNVTHLTCQWFNVFFYLLFFCNNTHTSDHVCGFEDERICGFSQDRSDIFDWTRQNHLTQNPKRSANTGPDTDRSGTKEGEKTMTHLNWNTNVMWKCKFKGTETKQMCMYSQDHSSSDNVLFCCCCCCTRTVVFHGNYK